MGNMGSGYDPCADDCYTGGGDVYRHRETGKEVLVCPCGFKGDQIPREELEEKYVKVGFRSCWEGRTQYNLNMLRSLYHITAFGFAALTAFAASSNPDGEEIVVSSLSPAVMAEQGITSFLAPIMPRGAKYITGEDVEAADLDVNQVEVTKLAPDEVVNYDHAKIVSRHKGTIDILQAICPDAKVLTGNVTPHDIRDCLVLGTLPPALIAECAAYQAATIVGFDYAKDGDLDGEELRQRLCISDPIKVVIK